MNVDRMKAEVLLQASLNTVFLHFYKFISDELLIHFKVISSTKW